MKSRILHLFLAMLLVCTAGQQAVARYYEPLSGRFISADPLGHGASMSLYDYANGDPVNGLDPDGRCASKYPDVASAAYVAGSLSSQIQQNYNSRHPEYTSDWQISESARADEGLAQAMANHGINTRDETGTLSDAYRSQAGQYYQKTEAQRYQDYVMNYPYVHATAETLNDPRTQVVIALLTLRPVSLEMTVAKSESGWLVPNRFASETGAVDISRTQWGWQNTPSWKAAANELDAAGNNATLLGIGGKIPTQAEAAAMIEAKGGTVIRIDPAHPEGGVSTHTYPHINYTTSTGNRATIRIQSVGSSQ